MVLPPLSAGSVRRDLCLRERHFHLAHLLAPFRNHCDRFFEGQPKEADATARNSRGSFPAWPSMGFPGATQPSLEVKFLLIPTMDQALGFPWVPAVIEANLQEPLAPIRSQHSDQFRATQMPPPLPCQITHSLTCSHYELLPYTFPTRSYLYLLTSMISAKPKVLSRALQLKPTHTSSKEPAQISLPELIDQRPLLP